MNISERLETGRKAYDSDNFSQNHFIDDIGISRNVYFDLKNNKRKFKDLLPVTRRRLLEGLELLGF